MLHKAKRISLCLYKSLQTLRNSPFLPQSPPFYHFCSLQNPLVVQTRIRRFDENRADQIKQAHSLSSNDTVTSLLEKYKKHRNKLVYVSEEIIFLKTFAEIIAQQGKHINLNHYSSMSGLLTKISSSLKNSEEEYPLVGSLLYSLEKLQVYNDKELWLILGDYVISERMDASFRECVQILKNASYIKTISDESYCDDFFDVLENIMLKEHSRKIMSIEDLLDISKNYDILKRNSPEFVVYLEEDLQKNLFDAIRELENIRKQDIDRIIKVCYYFSKLEGIGEKSLEYLQDIIERKISQGMLIPRALALSTENFSRFVFVFGRGQDLGMISIRDFVRQFVEEYIEDNQASYRLRHLIYLYKYLPKLGLKFSTEDIYQRLDLHILKINAKDISLEEVKDYMMFRQKEAFPMEIISHLDLLCSQNLRIYEPRKIYEFFEFIEEHRLGEKFRLFWKEFPEYFMTNLKHFDFEEWCLVYYVYMREKPANADKKIYENMDILKGYVYRYYNAVNLYHTSLPEKLNINSNFYKILEVVDANEFYEG